MTSTLPTIQPFIAGANPAEAWKYWRQDFEDYVLAVKYDGESEKIKTALFRHVCGNELKRQYRSIKFIPIKPATEVTLTQILDTIEKTYAEYNNEIYAAFCFLELKQLDSETFQQYYMRLTAAIEGCGYGNLSDRMLRDKLVHGLYDKPLQERILRDFSRKNTTLKQIIEECKAVEVSRHQALNMQEQAEIHAVFSKRAQNQTQRYNRREANHQKNAIKSNETNKCRSCGKTHPPNQCPAFGTVCDKCGYKNHWSPQCRTRPGNYVQTQQKTVNMIEPEMDNNNESIVFLGSITLHQVCDNKNNEITQAWYQEIIINGNIVKFKLDTGAQVNVIPLANVKQWKCQPRFTKPNIKVYDYSNNEIPIEGQCQLECTLGKLKANLTFLITNLVASPVLGLEACHKLKLIQKIHQMNMKALPLKNNKIKALSKEIIEKEFGDVFQGIGRLNKKVKIYLKDDAKPHIAAARKIPLALQPKVLKELENMVENRIIVKVEEPTEWVSAMVVVDTPKRLRICIDPRPLNKAIMRPHYPIPTTDQLLEKLRGKTTFTLLDAKNGFWQLPLEEESSYLTTFATPWGRFRYLVLPFGLNNGPEEFQKAMDEIYQSEPDINPYFDDLVLASNEDEHPEILRRALTIARKNNLKLNAEKIQLTQKEITYLGHRVSAEGIEMDPRKMEALTQYPAPTNVGELQRFLGMINYVSKFVPQISEETHQMRQLLKKEAVWIWDTNTEIEFNKVKQLITEAPILKFFHADKPTQLSVDASQHGLGAVLLQEGRPIAYGSTTLSETQSRYAPIERELLAIVYGLEHFNYFTYGRQIEVLTDHKPLIGLSEKPYETISPRIQRMLLRTNRYMAKFTYIPGKLQTTADALSRAPIPGQFNFEPDMKLMAPSVALVVTASKTKWEKIKIAVMQDKILQQILHYTSNGWPEEKTKVEPEVRKYWHCRQELHIIEEGILCRGQRLVIPDIMRKDILCKLHVAHRGIVATKNKAREYFYWPEMNTEIEDLISKCTPCQKYQRNNAHEPLYEGSIPSRPWQKVATDLFELNGNRYILLVDYFSKYIEVYKLNDATAPTIITIMKSTFARHGIPEEIVSDQGPPHNAVSMQEFMHQWDIKQTYSSPLYARANGQAERTIQTVKNTLRKTLESGQDLYAMLLDYRTTPIAGSKSPAELLMGRRLRSHLPVNPACLTPEFDISKAKSNLLDRQKKQQQYGNQHTKPLSYLTNKQKVWYRHTQHEPWRKGTIVKKQDQPRTYAIQTDNGKILSRNRYYIRPAQESSQEVANNGLDSEAHQETPIKNPREKLTSPNVIESENQLRVVPTYSDIEKTSDVTTQSGRVCKPPIKLSDYVCT